MNQSGLPVPALRRVRFGVQRAGQIRKIQGHHWSSQPGTRMRPEPLFWFRHVLSPKQKIEVHGFDGRGQAPGGAD
jgi:hypothetical protein